MHGNLNAKFKTVDKLFEMTLEVYALTSKCAYVNTVNTEI